MPLLPAEPNLFPENLFLAAEQARAEGRAWWVLHTKPRQEKSLARQMLQARVPFYLPVVKRRCLVRGRSMYSFVPLFPGYFFLLARPEEHAQALMTNRVANSLKVVDQRNLHTDLSQIYRLIATGAAVTPETRLVPGGFVEIRTGPMAGLKGKILRAASGHRFVVQVNFIQQGASVLLDEFYLAAINDPSGEAAAPLA